MIPLCKELIGNSFKYTLKTNIQADSVTVTVYDGSGTKRIDEAAMTSSDGFSWSIIFKTTTEWTSGDCIINTTAKKGIDQSIDEVSFVLTNKTY
ncbi:MAG: hypothetical protein JXB50_02300 [Spirochaetes bacterium]|nr:hypothetical protein [Spirochaetota bacterium]